MYKEGEENLMEKEKNFMEKWSGGGRRWGFWPRQVLQRKDKGPSHGEAGWKTDAEEKGSRNKRFHFIQKVILFSTVTLPLLSQAGQVKK